MRTDVERPARREPPLDEPEERVFSYCERCRLTKDNCEECEHREPLRKEKRDE